MTRKEADKLALESNMNEKRRDERDEMRSEERGREGKGREGRMEREGKGWKGKARKERERKRRVSTAVRLFNVWISFPCSITLEVIQWRNQSYSIST